MVGVNTLFFSYVGIGILIRAQKNRCFYCDCNLTGKARTRDHLKPKCEGNTLVLNCVICCLSCNQRKASSQPTEDHVMKARALYLKVGCPGFYI